MKSVEYQPFRSDLVGEREREREREKENGESEREKEWEREREEREGTIHHRWVDKNRPSKNSVTEFVDSLTLGG